MISKNSKTYISKKVNPILEKLVIEVVKKRPDNLVKFMVDWLNDKGVKIEEQLKDIHVDEESDDNDDDYSDNELMDTQALKKANQDKETRTSVSAEAYGKFLQKSNYKPKIVPKNDEQKKRIKERLSQAFMFQSLDDVEKKIIVDAMEEKKFSAGSQIISQGEDGNELYVVDSGKLDCYKRFGKEPEEKKIRVYEVGEAFGELALLYNAPRAATIKAQTDCTLFSLDRDTFNHIVKDAASKKREKYEEFLKKVDLLHDMSPYERMQIADALKTKKFTKGEYIVKEGDFGEIFFILEEGECIAQKNSTEQGKSPQTVYSYKPGEYFGEIALLKNSVRAASVIATSDGQAVYLDRLSFKRLLGPLEDILQRNFTKYEKYMV